MSPVTIFYLIFVQPPASVEDRFDETVRIGNEISTHEEIAMTKSHDSKKEQKKKPQKSTKDKKIEKEIKKKLKKNE